jgi:chemotaxis protein CheD
MPRLIDPDSTNVSASELRRAESRQTVDINIGQLFACRGGLVLRTLLGSCVSACLFDPVARVAGMNHILLPGAADLQRFDANARYGIHAMEMLINEMIKKGARRGRLQAKAFGGGHVLTSSSPESSPGQRNIDFLLRFFQIEKIPLLGQDFGGTWTRVLQFHTESFEIFVKRIQTGRLPSVLKDEERYRETLVEKEPTEGDATLFD